MNRHFFGIAFSLGALALAWVGAGFFGSQPLALAMTLVIAAAYGFGAIELHRFRQTTDALLRALATIPQPLTQLGEWLGSLPATLQNPVRLRIEGERVGLPGPALTPYLVGLLVMLGMLGTFLGMVATLNGAVFALEGTADLAAIRSAFAVPIKGLGLAFGTSVAGVATSAMLGLMSAICRRERLQAAQLLDSQIATTLRAFSHNHQRQETYRALQLQAHALPEVMGTMQAMMAQMERMGAQLGEQLLANQERFHTGAANVYGELARAVEQSLRESLAHSAHVAGESIKPVVESAMQGIADNATTTHQRLAATTQTQLQALAATLGETHARLQSDQDARDQQRMQAYNASLHELASVTRSNTDATLGEVARLVSTSEALVQARVQTERNWTEAHGQRMEQLASVVQGELAALREAEDARGQAAVQRLDALHSAVARHLTQLGQSLEAPIARLIETASEAPRAAAEVIGKLREEISHSTQRDNALLQERSRILETLNTLLASIHHASDEQRAVIDTLVASSAVVLQDAGGQFAKNVASEATKLADIAAQVTGSAVEVSSLGQAFGFAVDAFSLANEKLIANLQRIEAAMDKSLARSDDQLAYYVAQAREVIDLSLASQKEVVDSLRAVQHGQSQLAIEAA